MPLTRGVLDILVSLSVPQIDQKCLFYPSFLGLPSPLPGPSPLLRLVLSLLESSRPPRLPTGSWYYRGQLRKSRRWRQAAQAADVRDAGPGPERAQPGGFQSWILLPCGHPFVHHPRTGQTEGQSTGGPRAQLPLSLGEHHSISVSVTF